MLWWNGDSLPSEVHLLKKVHFTVTLPVLRSDLAFVTKAFHLWIVKAKAMSHLQVNLTRQWTRLMTLNLISILTWIY